MNNNITILISIDGLRADFDSFYGADKTPTLCSLAKAGVRVRHIIPQFTTITMPNHVSIATGLYAENHGVVGNTMFDWKMDDCWWSWNFFCEENSHLFLDKTKRWWENGLQIEGAEPIWTANQRQGGISGVYAWPFLKDLTISGILPQFRSACSSDTCHRIPFNEQVDTVVDWVAQSEKPANFVAMYISNLDNQLHAKGARAKETANALQEIDAFLAMLKSELERAGVWDRVNLLVTSDHGCVDVDLSKVVPISDYVDKQFYIAKEPSFWPIQCSTDFLYERLSKMPHMNVFTKEELRNMPGVNYANHWRVGPIVVIPDEGAFLINKPLGFEFFMKGAHSYDFNLPSMWPLLIAHGPAFKQSLVLPAENPVRQVDISAMCYHALGIKSPPSDGSVDRVRHIFK